MKMTRTQLSFPAEDLQRAKARARQLGISLTECVRRLVADDLEPAGAGSEPRAVFDRGRSGGTDIARDKDALVAEAFGPGGR